MSCDDPRLRPGWYATGPYRRRQTVRHGEGLALVVAPVGGRYALWSGDPSLASEQIAAGTQFHGTEGDPDQAMAVLDGWATGA